tara:strand:+ start:180 stop:425 length:246 start_codon:yes stop_codon:yes gene_type:complete
MKLRFTNKRLVEIIKSNTSILYNVDDIEAIFISVKKIYFYKIYFLNIKTNNKEIKSYIINKKSKEDIKREVFKIKTHINFH